MKKGKVNFVFQLFLRTLKESDLGFAVDKAGNFIFNDRNTGEELYILKEDVIKTYDEI